MRDAEAGPAGSVVLVALHYRFKELAGAIQILAASGAGHERRKYSAGLQILFGEVLRQRGSAMIFVCALQVAKALQGAEDLVADLRLDCDQIERGDVDGAAGANALAGHVEELPVEIESLVGAQEVSCKDKMHQQLFADAERIELLGGNVHQRTRWADDERRHPRQPRGDGVGQSVSVERSDVCGAVVDEGQHDDAVLRAHLGGGGLAEALGEHGEEAGGALLFFGCLRAVEALIGLARGGARRTLRAAERSRAAWPS